MNELDSLLNEAAVALMGCLSVLLVRRKLAQKLPFFFSYIILAILIELARLFFFGDYQLYFKVFWATEALYALLALLALHEAFHEVFILDYRDWPWFWMVFPGAVII